ncbi:protein ARABIDILLO 1-like isoform X2 [Arachis duranensis]|uniref:Protein ARABIDILLO 1-like isoform X2 n=1 Tax=Arachis duranensis TaxID=130453 RepID=A0A9C6TCE7_ARADU|nr:protein ARABIDILLO 1-like isoform X2 [Arachis duranensis]
MLSSFTFIIFLYYFCYQTLRRLAQNREAARKIRLRKKVRLKRYMKMRGADGGTLDMLCALPAFWAARALANLAAHGDSNSNNAAVGQEASALEALVQLTRSLLSLSHVIIRQEAAGALWNLSFDDRNREAIAAAGGVQALELKVCLNINRGS